MRSHIILGVGEKSVFISLFVCFTKINAEFMFVFICLFFPEEKEHVFSDFSVGQKKVQIFLILKPEKF